MQHGTRAAKAGIAGISLLVGSLPGWLTGCGFGGDVIAGMGSEVETAPPHGQSTTALPGPAQPGAMSNALVVTPRQRAYLDALADAGVHPSSELSALSIGSYVCQARAAKQTDQAVWDFVVPLVRNDVRDPGASAGVSAMVPSASEVQSATSDYIRIATERLC
ncbi:DUF732 domain-containing protein [Mycolicibacterium sp.]|uniref:DUF732 domain-containing protein n=1 Tax=Mycolicibacterium sp. TaxID=2320850 RepID=UPI003D0A26C2